VLQVPATGAENHVQKVEARVNRFVKNAWYVAASSNEVGRALTQRWIACEPVVFYRTEGGVIVGMEDRCPHRRAALSKGRLVGDSIQCGYHGMTFDCTGACVRIPGEEVIPPAMSVKTYSVIEKWKWIWIWMGDPAAADETLLPAFEFNELPGWVATGGCISVKANYQLLIDNLLDLTHETYVHGKTIGNQAVVETPMTWKMEGNEVHVQRVMRDTPPPPLFKKARNFETNIDRWQIIRFQVPSHVSIDARGLPMGTEDLEKGLRWFSINSITPIDERTSRYFWTITRCFDLDNEALSKMIHEQIYATFMEDVEVLEAQQVMIDTDRPNRGEISIRADGGSVAARRIIQRLLQRESAQTP
jgi:phenylpropionate dioxygenase-like ring-hydroxylating dioxygenase large terminal subunit